MAQVALDKAAPQRSEARAGVRGLASFPGVLAANPYQRLLYEQLGALGFPLADSAQFKLGWLVRNRRRVSILHFHWPEAYYRHAGGARLLRVPLSWAKVGLFAARLRAARVLGYRIVWTVHQVAPHEPTGRGLDSAATRSLARAAHLLVAHDAATAGLARARFGAEGRLSVVPHGSYVGVYPAGASREAVRERLGIAPASVAFLCFGSVRGYKQVGTLVDSFRAADTEDAVLVVAGPVGDEAAAERLASAGDARVKPLLGFLPEAEVAQLFGACDVAVVARSDGGTSGSLILALSLGLPVVAANTPAYAELTGGEACGWLFDPEDASSLQAALEQAAAAAPAERRRRGARALATAQALGWEEIGASLAAELDRLLAGARS